MKDLVQLRFSVPTSVSEPVTSLLTEQAGGVEQRDTETQKSMPPGVTELVLWLPESSVDARVKNVTKLLKSLEEMGQTVAPWNWSADPVSDEDWQEVYKQHFKVNRIGRYVVVKPSWETHEPRPQDLLVELDPGMAFGTGLHASTTLVVRAMERMAHNQPAPKSVVDLGTGTGILAIAAAKLWPATRVLAIDNDEVAATVCRENVAKNGLTSRVVVERRSFMELQGKFSLILANLTPELLAEFRPLVPRNLDSFGHMIISGMLAEAAPAVVRQYCKDLVLEPEYSEETDGWRAYLLELRE